MGGGQSEIEREIFSLMRIFDGQRMQLRKQCKVLLGSVGASPNPNISWQDHWEAPDATLN